MPITYVRPWNATIRNHCAEGRHMEALAAFYYMFQGGMRLDSYSVAATAKSCALLTYVALGKSVHGFVTKRVLGSAPPVEKALIDMYARFGLIHDSHQVFLKMQSRDSAAWNVLLSGYSRLHLYSEVVSLLPLMHKSSDMEAKPNAITFAVVLPIYAKLGEVKYGRLAHAYVVKNGLEEETLVGNALVSMYAKCGSAIADACSAFHLMDHKDVVSWNSIIAGFVENGLVEEAFDLFYQMAFQVPKPNYATVVNVLPICALLPQGKSFGKEIHCYVIRTNMDIIISVSNALVAHYARVGNLKDAEKVFRSMLLVDIVSWNTIINGYATHNWHQRALTLFHELLATGTELDVVTIITVLPVCAHLRNIEEGRKIHNYVLRRALLQKDRTIGNALVSFYGKCGWFDYAFRTFANISEKDMISWNAMLAAYADNGNAVEAIDILYHMNFKGIRADFVTILSILQVCTFLGMEKIKEIHGYSVRTSFVETPTVGNAIVDSYAKCGSIEHAIKMFQSLSGRDIVSSNTMISVYMKHGFLGKAIEIFEKMTERDLSTWNLMIHAFARNDYVDQAISFFVGLQNQLGKPDLMSIMSILPICVRLASNHLVKQCHGYIIRHSFDNIQAEGALLDAYCKCGSVYDAQQLFKSCSQKDIVTYTAIISGYAINGMAEEALTTFYNMLQSGIVPDHVIITSLLSACSHAGLMDEGLSILMKVVLSHGMKPTMEHYACVVDLFARRGQLKEAYDVIIGMPCKANANVWGTLLGACKKYGEVRLGQLVANHLFAIEEKDIGNYVVMSNIYAADERWDEVEQVRMFLRNNNLKKPAGCSWIEVERSRHIFVAADLSHPERTLIYHMLRILNWEIKKPFF